MKVIKLTTPWNHTFINAQRPDDLDFRFDIDGETRDCDYWLIWGGLCPNEEKSWALCPPSNVIFMTDEVHEQRKYDKKFLQQFNTVLTGRHDIDHTNVIKIHEFNHWHLKKSLQYVKNAGPIIKTKSLSVVCSDLTDLPGHKNRFALVNRLIGHFKDKLDVYGRGFNEITDKWDALAPYKYSIAIENNRHPGYFTEKLTECYLAHTFPVYFGAPDISKYFDEQSMLTIDIKDYRSCIAKIEKLLEEDPYDERESLIIKQKDRYLSRYHLFPAIAKLLRTGYPQNPSPIKRKITIRSQKTFTKYYHSRKLLHTIRDFF